jgi:signal transduction histidine kinase
MDAMPAGGRIWIRLSCSHDEIVLQVLDEGDGISHGIEESLFEAFVTTKASGLGLGLSICQEVAREHGARITLRTRSDDHGAIAEVVFPIQRSSSAREPTMAFEERDLLGDMSSEAAMTSSGHQARIAI